MEPFGFECRWAATIGRALAPAGVLGGVVDDVDLGARFREELVSSPWHIQLLMRFSLWLTWLAPLWLTLRPRTFGGLPVDKQEALLERLLDLGSYSLRMAVVFLKMTLLGELLGDERALGHLGAYRLVAPPSSRKAAS